MGHKEAIAGGSSSSGPENTAVTAAALAPTQGRWMACPRAGAATAPVPHAMAAVLAQFSAWAI